MTSNIYLQRTLENDDQIYAEDELLSVSKCVIILAEPGAGKTEFLKSLASKANTNPVTASKYLYSSKLFRDFLVIDALDELSKIDNCGIHKLLAKVIESKPETLIISSRSSEWSSDSAQAVIEYLECVPLVLRLREFNELEQRKIFDHHLPDEDFDNFYTEVSRFNLDVLLPNPQFLKMFADAYIESNRKFKSKSSIFEKAVEHLAKELNPSAKRRTGIDFAYKKKIELASEVFSKTLLSGAEGVSVSDLSEEYLYPNINALIREGLDLSSIIDSRLFKLADDVDQHRAVHKIIAEYCAAQYLVKRIQSNQDPLTLRVCKTVIVSNNIVRDELRGMLGWMATLGGLALQHEIIKLDPYAVLANGDPSQLDRSSKRLLLSQLTQIEKNDPYFRRGDFWRRYSTVGFFDKNMAEDIKPILENKSDGHLRDLVLTIIKESQVIEHLTPNLINILFEPNERLDTRRLAMECLFSLIDVDDIKILETLISESSNTSLNIAAKGIEFLGANSIDLGILKRFFRACSNLYPTDKTSLDDRRLQGNRYFINKLVWTLSGENTERLLNFLTDELTCSCGKEYYECFCRDGISKLVGKLLDHYFDITSLPYNSEQIWGWLKNLNYHREVSENFCKSVKAIRENKDLRQGLFKTVFSGLTERKKIYNLKQSRFEPHCGAHSGLFFSADDIEYLINLAFEENNLELWSTFITRHYYFQHNKLQLNNQIRSIMRKHANQKLEFMREWAKANNTDYSIGLQIRKRNSKFNKLDRKNKKCESQNRADNISFIQRNRALIESGGHFGWLVNFSECLLFEPENIQKEFGDEELMRTSLKNCTSLIAPDVPNLQKLAELRSQSQRLHVETVLYALCLETIRMEGTLDNISKQILSAVKTRCNIYYDAVTEDERDLLKCEIDRLLFPDVTSKENYLKEYVELQLDKFKCEHPEVEVLRDDEIFSDFKANLPLEWLNKYSGLSYYALDILFDLAVHYGDKEQLKDLILIRCDEWLGRIESPHIDKPEEKIIQFWFLRAFYFLNLCDSQKFFYFLTQKKSSIFFFEGISSSLNSGSRDTFPSLSSDKIYLLLDRFIEDWPQVNLPSSYGTSSPDGERAYRFLVDISRQIELDASERTIHIIEQLIEDSRFQVMRQNLKSMRANQIRALALRNFIPPNISKVIDLLDNCEIVTVEGLRDRVLYELDKYQKDIKGGEFNPGNRFYSQGGVRLDEVSSVEIIAEYLKPRLEADSIVINAEHQTKDKNRIDITASKVMDGIRRLLVIEAKGQWHTELFSAAGNQLAERYSIHPDAEGQGIYLVIWFGAEEKVANRKQHGLKSADELKVKLENDLPKNLVGLIDIFVLDVSKD